MAKAEIFKSLPTWAKGIIAVGIFGAVGVVFYTIYRKIQSATDKKDDRQELNAINSELAQSPVKPTLSRASAEGMANIIFTAMDGWQTDEKSIYSQIHKVKNDADWLLLQKAYGTRKISSGRGNIAPDYTGTLSGALHEELDSAERQAVNAILRKNGVKFSI